MNQRDVIKLLSIDEKLLELEVEIETTLVDEAARNKGTLLLSKGLKYKYDKLQKMRTNLVRNASTRMSRAQTYSLILEQRKREVIKAENEVKAIELAIVQIGALAITTKTALTEDFGIFTAELKRTKNYLMHKNRALDNWLAKSESDVVIPRTNTIAHSATMLSEYGRFKEKLKEDVAKRDYMDNIEFSLRTTEDVQKEITSFKYPTTSVSFEPHPSELQQEQDLNVVELTPEQIDERTLAEMRSVKYSIPVID